MPGNKTGTETSRFHHQSHLGTDVDGNENGKKAKGLYKQNDNYASLFFAHFFAVIARQRRENA